ncbi:FHA domain-containing protein [Larkinella punicea]|uniref:FHA domain-containing protein n=1 Tax=Larkinella punicea TaxID=2315727 RepID=UPI001403D3B9|nr:FHA domain-containing protein [Larkinella punicea]
MNVQELTLTCGNPACRARLTVRVKVPTQAKEVKCPKCGYLNPLPQTLSAPEQPADGETLIREKDNEETWIKTPGDAKPPLPEILGWLIVHDEKTAAQTFNLKKGRNTVGRVSQKSPSDLMIQTEDRYMSRPHCTLDVKINKMGQVDYVLQDGAAQPDGTRKNSQNGTFLNGQEPALHPSEQIYLKDGDTIQIGETKMVLKTFRMSESLQKAHRQVEGSDYTRTILSFT